MTGPRVLVVDDEPQILRALQLKLRGAGYAVDTAATAADALAAAAARPPDAVILDLLLPDGRGTDVGAELRCWTSAPILVLSAVGEEKEKIAALDAGADDYVTKPFGPDELVARVHAVLRRAESGGDEPSIVIGDLELDVARHSVTVAGEAVHLTPTEFSLLRTLVRYRGRLMTHSTLLREVWGPVHEEDTPLLRAHVANLRRKIEPDPSNPRYVTTDPGIGYRFTG